MSESKEPPSSEGGLGARRRERWVEKIKPKLELIMELERSEVAEKLSVMAGDSETDCLKAVEAMLTQAESQGLDAEMISVRPPPGFDRVSWIVELARMKRSAAALELLARKKASPWTLRIREATARELGSIGNPSSGAVIEFTDAKKMARLCAPLTRDERERIGEGNRKTLLEMALDSAALTTDEVAESFLTLWLERMGAALDQAMVEAPGIRGEADRQALRMARLALSVKESALRALSEREGQDEWLRAGEALMSKARQVEQSKSTQDEGPNPERMKKELSREQKARIRTLRLLLERVSEDDGAWRALMRDPESQWLKEKPLAASLRLGGSSLLGAALTAGRLDAIETLHQMGADIGWAAAQEGRSNPVEWALRQTGSAQLSPRERERMEELIASMLEKAARRESQRKDLMQASADSAIDQARKAIARLDRSDQSETAQRARGLLARLEARALSDQLARSDSKEERAADRTAPRSRL